ncbi:MAG: ADP-ribosylglycohydrolase family protein [Chloroflexota bacterium]
MNAQRYRGLVVGMFVGDILARQQISNRISLSRNVTEALDFISTSNPQDESFEQNLLVALLIGARSGLSDETSESHAIVNRAMIHLAHLAQTDTQPIDYMTSIWQSCSGHDPLFDMTLRKIGHVLGFGSSTHALRLIETSNKDATIFTMALYCIMRYPDDFSKAMETAILVPYQAHIVASITGGIIGWRHGHEIVSQQWRNLIERTIDIESYLRLLSV